MFLRLLFGRKTPDETMTNLGFVGPVFQLEGTVHMLYTSHVSHMTSDGRETLRLWYVKDCLYYDGMYYGEWIVTEKPPMPDIPTRFDPEKAIIPR